MATCNYTDRSQKQANEQRLPPGQSIAVIAGLSVLSWAVLILFIRALV